MREVRYGIQNFQDYTVVGTNTQAFRQKQPHQLKRPISSHCTSSYGLYIRDSLPSMLFSLSALSFFSITFFTDRSHSFHPSNISLHRLKPVDILELHS